MLLNNYIENVTIKGNSFKNITQEAIACVNYINSKIEDNKMENVGGGILFHFSKTSNDSVYTCIKNGKQAYEGKLRTNAQSSIQNNTIETRYHSLCDKNVGIELYGRNISQKMHGAEDVYKRQVLLHVTVFVFPRALNVPFPPTDNVIVLLFIATPNPVVV